MIVAVVLFALLYASLLGLAALHVFVLRHGGPNLDPAARLWARLKVVEYGLLLVFVIAAVSGVPRWALLSMAAAWVALVFARSLVKRRIDNRPPERGHRT
jgi:hypothetical protein